MKLYITILLLLITLPAPGQNSYCFCSEDSAINEGAVSCDTTVLSNNGKLYWQYNCDSIWLTLENANGQKIVIDHVSVEVYEDAFKIGFQFIKEFDSTLLFVHSCSGSFSCLYTLIDKNSGKEIKVFNQLICIYDDEYNFNFVVYLSDTTDHIIIYYVNDNKILQVPFKEKLEEIIPEDQFEKMTLNNNILTLIYVLDGDKKKTLNINLNDKKYSR
jgi:hypothetical protein